MSSVGTVARDSAWKPYLGSYLSNITSWVHADEGPEQQSATAPTDWFRHVSHARLAAFDDDMTKSLSVTPKHDNSSQDHEEVNVYTIVSRTYQRLIYKSANLIEIDTSLSKVVFENLSLGAQTWPSHTRFKQLNSVDRVQKLKKKLVEFYADLRDYKFEDGYEGRVSQFLRSIEEEGADALVSLRSVIQDNLLSVDCLLETLVYLGNSEIEESLNLRISILEFTLLHRSAVIRDGAAIGLALTESKLAIPVLRTAIDREEKAVLKADMEELLCDLRAVAH